MRKPMMLISALITGLALPPLWAQDSKSQQRFAGTWEAKYKGTVFCTIKLEAGERISGSTVACNIRVDENGDLMEPDSAGNSDKPSPILNPGIHGDTLSFEVKDDDDEEQIKLEMQLTGEGQADVRFIDTPTKIKPIHFTRK
jgi:hypothetical protein